MKQKPKLVELNINEIEATAGTQVRRVLDNRTIADYGESMLAGAIFPPITVFSPKNSKRYVLADGFHRLAAAAECGYESFPCEVFTGSVHDALEYALGANEEHGLRRSNKDKRHAVELALKDPKWSKDSSEQIARLCRVSATMVRTVRTELNLVPDKVTGKDGVTQAAKKPKEPKPDKPPADPDVGNKKDLLEVIGLLMSLPFDGTEAVERLGVGEMASEFEYCRDWFAEAAEAAK